MITIAELRKPLTYSESLDFTLDLLQGLGFDTTGWQEGRIQKSLITTFAMLCSEMSEGAAFAANANSNEYASGVPLTIYSKQRFDNDRQETIATVGPITFTNTSSSSHTLKPGEFLASTPTGVEFVLTSDVTIPAGSTASPSTAVGTVQCTLRGAIGNVGSGTITKALTPIAGVSITNTGSPWYTTAGRDDEIDASLKATNRSKWATLAVEYPADAYSVIARNAGAAKTRVDATNPRGPGTIDVFCAGQTSILPGLQLVAIQQAFSERVFYTDDTIPSDYNSRVSVRTVATFPLNVTVHVYRRSDVSATQMETRIKDALTGFLVETPIGGWDYPTTSNVILSEDIRRRIEQVDGVVSFTVSLPSAESISVPLNALVVQGTWTVTSEVIP